MATRQKGEVSTAPDTDTEIEKARKAELKRQQDVRDAVDKANKDELPKLGGTLYP